MKLWIVVADSSSARIFCTEGRGAALELVQRLTHAASRARDAAINTDRPGRVRKHATPVTVFSMTSAVSPHETEVRRFASEVSKAVREGFDQRQFDSLALVAPARFMGLLRNTLAAAVAPHLLTTLRRNLVRVPEHDLCPRLEPIFDALEREEHRRVWQL